MALQFVKIFGMVCTTAMLCTAVYAQNMPEEPEKNDRDITVRAHKNGDYLVIDSSFSVAATREEVWAVLTDFEHLPQFISNLETSKVLEHTDNKYKVAQKGKASHAILTFKFESVQEISLHPYDEIEAHLVSGTMKQMDGVTHVVTEEGVTRVVYHGVSIPDVWIPPLVGTKLIEAEMREQYREVRKEILRRKSALAHS